MSHHVNDSIFENLSEEYQIHQMIIELEGNIYPQIRYVIRDENEKLVRHNDRSFFATKDEAEKTLCEIVQKRFEEQAG